MRHLTLAIVLIAGLAAPACADFKAGQAACDQEVYATAYREILPLAEQGNAKAQLYLGLIYFEGRGVTQDYAEAVKWFRLAAEQGDQFAQAILGGMYSEGRGVTQDYAEAVEWYRLAAEQGDYMAQHNLGIMYSEGRGVTRDYVQAHMWSNLAASGLPVGEDRDQAVKSRDLVEKLMTPPQVAEAQRLARQWKPKAPTVARSVMSQSEPITLSRDGIKKLQEDLAALGYNPGPADGIVRKRTKRAIRAFESDCGLPVTGEVSERLRREVSVEWVVRGVNEDQERLRRTEGD